MENLTRKGHHLCKCFVFWNEPPSSTPTLFCKDGFPPSLRKFHQQNNVQKPKCHNRRLKGAPNHQSTVSQQQGRPLRNPSRARTTTPPHLIWWTDRHRTTPEIREIRSDQIRSPDFLEPTSLPPTSFLLSADVCHAGKDREKGAPASCRSVDLKQGGCLGHNWGAWTDWDAVGEVGKGASFKVSCKVSG